MSWQRGSVLFAGPPRARAEGIGLVGQGGRGAGALLRRVGDDLRLAGLVARDDVRVGRGRAAGGDGRGRRRARGDVVGAPGRDAREVRSRFSL